MKATVLCTLLLLCPSAAFSQAPAGHDVTTRASSYFSTNDEGLDSTAILPPPPAVGSVRFLHDEARYREGLIERRTERGRLAARDADLSDTGEMFSEAFGMAISRENTPAIHALIRRLRGELGSMATRAAKRHYGRLRPFVLYDDPTCYRPDEDRVNKNGSYPSGHSSLGWGLALVLTEINPQNKEAILRRGYEIGESRVICGYHWQSDVDAGRLAASAAVATLHANEEFLEMLQKAKEEFRIKSQASQN